MSLAFSICRIFEEVESFMKKLAVIAAICMAASPLMARDGKSFNIGLQHVSGESSTSGNALRLEGARDINNTLKGGLAFQTASVNPRYSGPGITLGLSSEDYNWGWKLSLDFAKLSASNSEIIKQDYSSLSINSMGTSISTANTTGDQITLSSNKLQKIGLGYTADIYAFRQGGAALEKLGIRVGGRLRSDDLKLADSLVLETSTSVVTMTPPGTSTITVTPLGVSIPNDHKIDYKEHALELLAGLSYRYDVTRGTALDVAATGVYGKGIGKYSHKNTALQTLSSGGTPISIPSTRKYEGDTKVTRIGFLAELGLSYSLNEKLGLRFLLGIAQIQSKVDESTVKDLTATPLAGLTTGDFLPYILDITKPLGSNPASTDREQRIGLELKVAL
jgi:hypothetical protein